MDRWLSQMHGNIELSHDGDCDANAHDDPDDHDDDRDDDHDSDDDNEGFQC